MLWTRLIKNSIKLIQIIWFESEQYFNICARIKQQHFFFPFYRLTTRKLNKSKLWNKNFVENISSPWSNYIDYVKLIKMPLIPHLIDRITTWIRSMSSIQLQRKGNLATLRFSFFFFIFFLNVYKSMTKKYRLFVACADRPEWPESADLTLWNVTGNRDNSVNADKSNESGIRSSIASSSSTSTKASTGLWTSIFHI